MITGVYKIVNKINGKYYIGSAENIINHRWLRHKSDLRLQNHHSKHLENAWCKYGEDNFVWEIIEECSKEMLLEREQYWLDIVRIKNADGTLGEIDHNLSYNINPTAGSCLGVKHSEETKKKIGEAGLGKKNHFYGKHHTEETKEKLRKLNLGKKLTEEHKQKLRGKILTEEHKQKLRIASTGKRHTEEAKKKISESHKGKIFSADHRRKLSEVNKGKYCGEKSPVAKLNWFQVEEIRNLFHNENFSKRKLSKLFGVSRTTIKSIIDNKIWVIKNTEEINSA